jgi:hypothetical protein
LLDGTEIGSSMDMRPDRLMISHLRKYTCLDG